MTDIRGIRTAEELRTWLAARGSVRLALRASGLPAVPAVDVDASAPPAIARVNHGEWTADCPMPRCDAALLLTPGAPFLCPRCFNAAAAYRWRPVQWPAERAEIEATLLRQPLQSLRNWEPGIEVEDLLEAVEAEVRGEGPRHVRDVRQASDARRRRRAVLEERER